MDQVRASPWATGVCWEDEPLHPDLHPEGAGDLPSSQWKGPSLRPQTPGSPSPSSLFSERPQLSTHHHVFAEITKKAADPCFDILVILRTFKNWEIPYKHPDFFFLLTKPEDLAILGPFLTGQLGSWVEAAAPFDMTQALFASVFTTAYILTLRSNVIYTHPCNCFLITGILPQVHRLLGPGKRLDLQSVA